MTQHEQFNHAQLLVESLGYRLVIAAGFFRLCNKKFEKIEDFTSLDKAMQYVTIMQERNLL